MRFSDLAWETARPIFDAILEQPFNRELADGTLRSDRFRFYILQDAVYLVSFARTFAVAAAKAQDAEAVVPSGIVDLKDDFRVSPTVREYGHIHDLHGSSCTR